MNSDFAQARFNMVQQQIRPWDVLDDRVLELMERAPRDVYVPDGYQPLAYADTEIPIGHGQTMLAPRIEARLMQALAIQPTDSVLEIGTGTGYLAACLGELGQSVKTIEIIPELAEKAAAKLAERQMHNVNVVAGDGLAAQDGRYDVIAVGGSIPMYSGQFKENLNVGGRLFVVTGDGVVQCAALYRRTDETTWTHESLFETVLTPLIGAPEPDPFVF